MFTPPVNQMSVVHATGSPDAKLAVVGDISNGFDIRALQPFSGVPGQVLDRCLHAANLIRGATYLTNMIKPMPKKKYKDGNEYFTIKNNRVQLSELGLQAAKATLVELDDCKANVIVAAGPIAAYALCGLQKLRKHRGYIFESTNLQRPRKVIPTFSPADSARGQFTNQHMIVADLQKARQEMEIPELVRPERNIICEFTHMKDVLDWLDYYSEVPVLGFDIEVINYEVACISLAADERTACVIPIVDAWELDDELLIWRGIQKALGNPSSAKVVQNGMFDIPFLRSRNGVIVRGPIHDTMVGHHIAFPDLPKSLGFLGSIYCGAQYYWKDLVKFSNIKEDN